MWKWGGLFLPCNMEGASPEFTRRQKTLRERIAAIDDQVAELSRQRARLSAELSDVDLEADGAKRAKLAPADDTGAASAIRRSLREPKKWRYLHEVEAEVTANKAAGVLLPFGAPGRVPRVYVDGCFDMMHSGHMNAVRQAKLIAESVGGVLVVGVHTDAEIERNKGPPVMRDAERIALVAAVKWVDELIFDTPYSATLPFLDAIDCEYCVHGDDISINADGTDAYAEAKAAGRMKVVKRTEGVSTTDLVGRLLLFSREHHTPFAPSAEPMARSPGGTAASPLATTLMTSASAAAAAAAAVAASAAAAAAAAAAASGGSSGYAELNISSSGVSQFLPTTWRLRAFSNGRVARPTEKIVYVHGTFDLLHAGHVMALYEARQHGDFLLVGLHDDATVNRLRGRNHPIASLHERALCVLALGCVDEVILGAPARISADLLKSMNIHVVVGDVDEPNAEEVEEAPADPAATPPPTPGGLGSGRPPLPTDPHAVPREKGIYRPCGQPTTLRLSEIVTRIIANRQRYEARNAKRERKELDYVLNQKAYVEEL